MIDNNVLNITIRTIVKQIKKVNVKCDNMYDCVDDTFYHPYPICLYFSLSKSKEHVIIVIEKERYSFYFE
jgi:hypothetical protein